jgi:phosphoglycerate dehydrogenase-like enzyme
LTTAGSALVVAGAAVEDELPLDPDPELLDDELLLLLPHAAIATTQSIATGAASRLLRVLITLLLGRDPRFRRIRIGKKGRTPGSSNRLQTVG